MHSKCQAEAVAYENLDHSRRNAALLKKDNNRDLPHVLMLMKCLVHVKSHFQEKKSTGKLLSLVLLQNRIILQHFIVPISALLSVKWLLM